MDAGAQIPASADEMKPNEPPARPLLRLLRFFALLHCVLKEDAPGRSDRPRLAAPLRLNRLMAAQVRAGTLQWKMKLEETAGPSG